jgi:hypothetical protein
LYTIFILSTARKHNAQICQELPKSAKIKQRSTKGSTGMSLQALLAETDHDNAKPQNEGAAVSRRMASSIRSGPEGARGVFKTKATFRIFYFPIDVFFH